MTTQTQATVDTVTQLIGGRLTEYTTREAFERMCLTNECVARSVPFSWTPRTDGSWTLRLHSAAGIGFSAEWDLVEHESHVEARG